MINSNILTFKNRSDLKYNSKDRKKSFFFNIKINNYQKIRKQKK